MNEGSEVADLLSKRAGNAFAIYNDIRNQVSIYRDASIGAYLVVDGEQQHYPIGDGSAARWFRRWYEAKRQTLPSTRLVNQIIEQLRAHSDTAPQRTLTIRVATENLGDAGETVHLALRRGRYVTVNSDGWSIQTSAGADVILGEHSKDLPDPQRGGSLLDLRRFLPYRGEALSLVLVWLLACLRRGADIPMLALVGPAGTGKSTAMEILLGLLDPGPAAAAHDSDRDLLVAMANHWIFGLDNITSFNTRTSNLLCNAITGGAMQHRRLFSDNRLVQLAMHQPVIVSGLSPRMRNDLADRVVAVEHRNIRKVSKVNLLRDFEQQVPFLLGALLDAMVKTLQVLPRTSTMDYRMADFARLAVAASTFVGSSESEMKRILKSNKSTTVIVLTGKESPIGALIGLMSDQDEWTGTAEQLAEVLQKRAGVKVGDAQLSKMLEDKQRELAEAGLFLRRHPRTADKKLFTLTRFPEGPEEACGEPENDDDDI